MTLRSNTLLACMALACAALFGCAARQPAAPAADANADSEQSGAPRPFAEQRARLADIEAVVAAGDRSAEDRALDSQRRPTEMLLFYAIQPGIRVAELAAGTGYTTELLARAVGPEGTVFGHNTPFILDRFAEKPWSERLQKPVMRNVVRIDREFDDPFPPEVTNLDAVFLVLFYHDTVWMKTDRAKMNRAVFDALRRGGVYAVIDHNAAKGAGVRDAESLHRIEESTVIHEVQEAGFRLESTATFLRNPADTHDWNAAPRAAGDRRGTSDRFVLLFRKP